jgi:hypothetical protein
MRRDTRLRMSFRIAFKPSQHAKKPQRQKDYISNT